MLLCTEHEEALLKTDGFKLGSSGGTDCATLFLLILIEQSQFLVPAKARPDCYWINGEQNMSCSDSLVDKAACTQSDDLGSELVTHKVEGQIWLFPVVLWHLHVHHSMHTTLSKINTSNKETAEQWWPSLCLAALLRAPLREVSERSILLGLAATVIKEYNCHENQSVFSHWGSDTTTRFLWWHSGLQPYGSSCESGLRGQTVTLAVSCDEAKSFSFQCLAFLNHKPINYTILHS